MFEARTSEYLNMLTLTPSVRYDPERALNLIDANRQARLIWFGIIVACHQLLKSD